MKTVSAQGVFRERLQQVFLAAGQPDEIGAKLDGAPLSTSYQRVYEALRASGNKTQMHGIKRLHHRLLARAYPDLTDEQLMELTGHRTKEMLHVYLGAELMEWRTRQRTQTIQRELQRVVE